jgi:type IV pilus assembly protein PilA
LFVEYAEMKTSVKDWSIRQEIDDGFTLVELLVVVIIIGILSAISLPAYLSLTASAKQLEARTNMNAIMTSQQLWIDSKSSGIYPASLDELALGVVKGSTKVDNVSSSVYKYSIADDAAVNQMSAGAEPKDPKLKAYSSGVRSFFNAANNNTWYSVMCESESANALVTPPISIGTGASSNLICPANYQQVKVSR